MGVIEEVGSDVKKVKAGQRYVCCFDIGCGDCFYCKHNLYSCCMRSNPSNMTCGLYGHKLGGFYGEISLASAPLYMEVSWDMSGKKEVVPAQYGHGKRGKEWKLPSGNQQCYQTI